MRAGQCSYLQHDVDFAYRWAERVIVFCHGKIIADDTPLAVFKQEDIFKAGEPEASDDV